jgi:hypothetical protein
MKQIPVSHPSHTNSCLQESKTVYAVLVAVIILFQFLRFWGKDNTRVLVKYKMIIDFSSFHLIFLPIIAKLQKRKALVPIHHFLVLSVEKLHHWDSVSK